MGLTDLLGKEILVFDGAMGTLLQSQGLPAGHCPDAWCLGKPDVVGWAHRQYIEAGAQIIETNTFGATPIRLAHYGLRDKIGEINLEAVRIAREAAGTRALVAASMGPLGVLVEPLGDFTFDEAYDEFSAQAEALKEAAPDFIIIETISDLNEIRAAILACKDHAPGIKIIAQMTIDVHGRSFTGTDPETAGLVLQSMGADIVGFNCSVGPDLLVQTVERLARVARVPISVQPNAGTPHLSKGGRTVYPMGPEEFASYGPKLVAAGAAIVGGCCGTTPDHIRLLRGAVSGLRPKSTIGPLGHELGLASRTQALFFVEGNLPVIVGERINPTGRRLLAKGIKEGSLALVRQEAIAQTGAGAKALDVNVSVPLIDEREAMTRAVRVVQDAVPVPVCLDSTSPDTLEAGLKAFVGKALINSFSLEEGRAEAVLPLAKRYGAAVIGLAVDEKGIPSSAVERVDIARRLVETAAAYGIPCDDLVIDPLALTAGAQQAQAVETLKAIRMIRSELGCRTSLGISNVSFGLPNRRFLNAVYLSMAVTAGLDMAIVNPLDDRLMDTVRALQVFLNRDPNAKEYISAVGAKKLYHTVEEATGARGEERADGQGEAGVREGPAYACERVSIQPENGAPLLDSHEAHGRKIYSAVLEGNKDGVLSLVEEALSRGIEPMHILDRHLVPAIEETGRLFGEGAYFLPQLMSSAAAMQAAFERLRPEIQKSGTGQISKGTVVFATVEGDIHDVGKNIISLLLQNHGFRVVDLGKNVSSGVILEEARKVSADIVCLSALMTTTMPKMKEVIDLFVREGLDCPVLVGGAATTRSFAEEIGASGYGKDAQEAVVEVLRLVSQRRSKTL